MALINLTGALLSPGPITLLDRVSLGLHPGERLGLVGRNGAGKSSLLRVLHGTQTLDAGERKVATGLRIGHMAQNPSNQGAATVFDSVAAELSSARQARAALEVCTDARELASLHAQVEALDAWRWEDRAREVISRVGLSESARIADLSGGAQRRLALASCLVTQPDVLLLDEPTNHLDLDAIVWLETWLRGFRGAMVVVSHDRSFLDAVCNSVVEVDRGRLHRYEGDFSSYLIQREARWAQEAVEQAKADRLLAAEEVWIRQGVEARRTRAQARIKRLDDLREQRAQRRQRAGQARLEIQRGAIGGQVVASLESASFAYGPTQSNAPLVDALDLIVLRGDKLAIVGPNGSGKTTLIRLLLGELLPTRGHVHHGTRLRIAYFDQMRDGIAPDTTLATFLQPDGDWIDLPSGKVHVRRYLADFLFDPQRAHHRIETLSGGERARLMLARLFAQPANLLVLDEPTNDLDIDTIELLEERLAAFDGTVILVSHDRRFLDNVATSVLAFEGPGRWIGYEGNVTDWLTQATRRVATTPPPADTPRPVATPEAPARAPSKTKLSYREQREFDDLPGRIEALEAEQASITEELAKGTVYSADPARAADLAARHEAIEHELMQALERWEALDSRAKN